MFSREASRPAPHRSFSSPVEPRTARRNSGCTLTTPNRASSSSRFAAIIQRKLICPPGAATFGWYPAGISTSPFSDDGCHLGWVLLVYTSCTPNAGAGGVDIEIRLFGQDGVLVRRPRRPVAWRAEGHSRISRPASMFLPMRMLSSALVPGPPAAKCSPGSLTSLNATN